MEVRLTPGGMTVPEAPPGEGQSARRAVASESGEVLPRRDSGADAQDRPAGFGLDKEDLKDLLRRTTDAVEALGPSGRHLKYEVIDTLDGNIVRKVPADEIVKLVSRIRETLDDRLDVVA